MNTANQAVRTFSTTTAMNIRLILAVLISTFAIVFVLFIMIPEKSVGQEEDVNREEIRNRERQEIEDIINRRRMRQETMRDDREHLDRELRDARSNYSLVQNI